MVAKTPSELTRALRQSSENQKRGVTTFIETVLNQELGEPFRRDAMKKPVTVGRNPAGGHEEERPGWGLNAADVADGFSFRRAPQLSASCRINGSCAGLRSQQSGPRSSTSMRQGFDCDAHSVRKQAGIGFEDFGRRTVFRVVGEAKVVAHGLVDLIGLVLVQIVAQHYQLFQ